MIRSELGLVMHFIISIKNTFPNILLILIFEFIFMSLWGPGGGHVVKEVSTNTWEILYFLKLHKSNLFTFLQHYQTIRYLLDPVSYLHCDRDCKVSSAPAEDSEIYFIILMIVAYSLIVYYMRLQ